MSHLNIILNQFISVTPLKPLDEFLLKYVDNKDIHCNLLMRILQEIPVLHFNAGK